MKDKSVKEKVANYLTQLKELPEEVSDSKKLSTKVSNPKPIENRISEQETRRKETIRPGLPTKDEKVKKLERSMPVAFSMAKSQPLPESEESEETEDSEARDKKIKGKLSLSARDIILGAVNIITLVILLFILVRLPKMAQELKKLKDENATTGDNISLQMADIEANKEKAEKLNAAFLNDSGVVDFVKEIESLKPEGTITKLSFASQKAVNDKTGSFGIPVIIDLNGDWSEILVDLGKIQQIPFLFRTVSIEAEPKPEGGKIELKYGGFLYVEDKLGEN